MLKAGFASLEAIRKVKHVVFDKTGTLTAGALTDAQVIMQHGRKEPSVDEYMLLCAAEGADQHTHPAGRAVFQWAMRHLDQEHRRKQTSIELRNVVREIGAGICCEARPNSISAWQNVCIGNRALFDHYKIPLPLEPPQSTSGAIVYFAFDRIYSGKVKFQETLRDGALETIEQLTRRGIRVSMLTGDNMHEAQRISHALGGIRILAAQSLPHEKGTTIASLRTKGSVIAMVGDGLNDLPAQAAADVGVLLLLPDSPNRGNAADVIISSGNIDTLPALFEIADRAVRQARWNVAWAGLYNTCAIAIALGAGETRGIHLTVPRAAFLMSLSSILVLCSSLWLQRSLQGKPPSQR